MARIDAASMLAGQQYRELRRRPLSRTGGFTLVELLLVLALLVVIAGFTAASLEGSLQQSKLREGTERVRTAWSDARHQAVSAGERLVFTCLIGGRDFRLSSCNDLFITPAADQPEAAGQTGQLPEGVVFRSAQAAPGKLLNSPTGAPPPDDGQWSAPIVFNPNGTSYDAVLILEGESGRQVQLSLRGLTCTATSADINAKGERLQ